MRRLALFLLLLWVTAVAATSGSAGPKTHAAPSRTSRPALAMPDAAGGFDTSVRPFLSEYCFKCHNDTRHKGDLNLKAFTAREAVAHNPEVWEEVLLKLRTGEMPPEDEDRPTETELQNVTLWLETELLAAYRLTPPDPGRVTARRLNRAEYNNTVRDLLGVDLRPADEFPQDDAGYGFDNIGDVLSISPVLMERYVAAAEKLVRTALFGSEPLKPTLTRMQTQARSIVESPTPRLEYDVTGLSLPNAFHVMHRIPVDGDYVIRVMSGGVRPLGSDPVDVALWVDGKPLETQTFDPAGRASFDADRQNFTGTSGEFRVKLTAGDHWIAASILRLFEGLPASYGGPKPTSRPEPPPPEFKPPRNATPERIERARKAFEERLAQKAPANGARIAYLEILGPYAHARGASARSLRLLYACGHTPRGSRPASATQSRRPASPRHGSGQAAGPAAAHSPSCVRTNLAAFARRAFRRPVTRKEVDSLVALVAGARRQGNSREESLGVGLQAILVSPDFLFRMEKGVRPVVRGDPVARGFSPGTAGEEKKGSDPLFLTHHELATRLAYFLWSSTPDEELLRAADMRTLRRPAALAAQVRRMLKDPKARALVENFGGQWLEFRALESAAPDRERFPDFDDYLRLSMRRETELFFESIVREDRSILDFIDARYTFLNQRLARHYQVPGVTGPEFRRVELSGPQRGGVLTHASVLTVSSYPTRTSPVLRGKWILENILNAPPPPPPPGAANLDEATVKSAASLREQLEAHRSNATCASCHRRMDPLGFGLENYDAIGAWRVEDGTFPVDASGTLPDGRTFRGAEELKGILKADREFFARALTAKLLTYALGRGLERYDRRTVIMIAKGLEADDYRFSSLIRQIVTSAPFQMRRADPVPMLAKRP